MCRATAKHSCWQLRDCWVWWVWSDWFCLQPKAKNHFGLTNLASPKWMICRSGYYTTTTTTTTTQAPHFDSLVTTLSQHLVFLRQGFWVGTNNNSLITENGGCSSRSYRLRHRSWSFQDCQCLRKQLLQWLFASIPPSSWMLVDSWKAEKLNIWLHHFLQPKKRGHFRKLRCHNQSWWALRGVCFAAADG